MLVKRFTSAWALPLIELLVVIAIIAHSRVVAPAFVVGAKAQANGPMTSITSGN